MKTVDRYEVVAALALHCARSNMPHMGAYSIAAFVATFDTLGVRLHRLELARLGDSKADPAKLAKKVTALQADITANAKACGCTVDFGDSLYYTLEAKGTTPHGYRIGSFPMGDPGARR